MGSLTWPLDSPSIQIRLPFLHTFSTEKSFQSNNGRPLFFVCFKCFLSLNTYLMPTQSLPFVKITALLLLLSTLLLSFPLSSD